MHNINNLKVSIIIPVFNGAAYLSYSLSSVIKQTHKNIEVIVVDDGSTDKSKQKVKDYRDSRIAYHWQKNRGKNSALNLGLKISNGDFIMFFDQDDYMPSNYVSDLLTTIFDNGADIATSSIHNLWGFPDFKSKISSSYQISSNQLEKNKISFFYGPEEILKEYFFGIKIGNSLWNKIYSRDLLKDFEFNTNFQLDDRPNLYRILIETKKLVHNHNLYFYHLNHANSMGYRKMFEVDYISELIQIDLNLIKELSNNIITKNFFKRIEFQTNSEIIKNYIRIGLLKPITLNNREFRYLNLNSSFLTKILIFVQDMNFIIKSASINRLLIKIMFRKFNYYHLLETR